MNHTIIHNKDLKDKINSLRRDRAIFDQIYQKMESKLSAKKKHIATLVEIASRAYISRDAAHERISTLKKQADEEYKRFEDQWEKLNSAIDAESKIKKRLRRLRTELEPRIIVPPPSASPAKSQAENASAPISPRFNVSSPSHQEMFNNVDTGSQARPSSARRSSCGRPSSNSNALFPAGTSGGITLPSTSKNSPPKFISAQEISVLQSLPASLPENAISAEGLLFGVAAWSDDVDNRHFGNRNNHNNVNAAGESILDMSIKKLRRKVVRNAWGILKGKAATRLAMERAAQMEQSLLEIKQKTGATAVASAVKDYVSANGHRDQLVDYINQLTKENESIEKEVEKLKHEISTLELGEEVVASPRRRILNELDSHWAKVKLRSSQYDDRFVKNVKSLAALREGLMPLLAKFGLFSSDSVQQNIGSTVTSANLLSFIGLLENRTNELIHAYTRCMQKQQKATVHAGANSSIGLEHSSMFMTTNFGAQSTIFNNDSNSLSVSRIMPHNTNNILDNEVLNGNKNTDDFLTTAECFTFDELSGNAYGVPDYQPPHMQKLGRSSGSGIKGENQLSSSKLNSPSGSSRNAFLLMDTNKSDDYSPVRVNKMRAKSKEIAIAMAACMIDDKEGVEHSDDGSDCPPVLPLLREQLTAMVEHSLKNQHNFTSQSLFK